MEEYKTRMDNVYAEHFSQKICMRPETACPSFRDCKKSFCGKAAEEIDAISKSDYSFFDDCCAKIGENYGLSGIPKIVFIGKESTCKHTETTVPENFEEQKNQHYRRTRAILAALLGITDEIEVGSEIYSFRPENSSDTYKLHTIFSLTNHYHCAFKKTKKAHGVRSTYVMWDKCTEIVKKELKILNPDIVVIQAGWSTKQGADKDIAKYFTDNYVVTLDPNCPGLYWLVDKYTKEKRRCVIGSYHPSFHCWHQEKYIVPLNDRINRAKVWLTAKNQPHHSQE